MSQSWLMVNNHEQKNKENHKDNKTDKFSWTNFRDSVQIPSGPADLPLFNWLTISEMSLLGTTITVSILNTINFTHNI